MYPNETNMNISSGIMHNDQANIITEKVTSKIHHWQIDEI